MRTELGQNGKEMGLEIKGTESGYSVLGNSLDKDSTFLCTVSSSHIVLAGMLNLVGCYTGRNSLRNRRFWKVSCAMEK